MDRKNKRIALYLDMDGCFADFEKGARQAFEHFHHIEGLYGDSVMTIKQKAFREDMIQDIVNTPNFWRNLDWCEGGEMLWSFIERYNDSFNISVLTAPLSGDYDRCKREKLEWCKDKFNGLITEKNFICDDDKWKYVNHIDGRKQILIDDREKNIVLWERAGGIGILHNNKKWLDTILQICEHHSGD